MSESLVDLLLVRLGREEEKRKVLKLLVTSLDLSVSDAEDAVNNSPSVIREAVPMGEARTIQKDLYPYIDLLPRFDDDEEADQEPDDYEDEEEIEEVGLEPDTEESDDEEEVEFDDGLPIEPVNRETPGGENDTDGEDDHAVQETESPVSEEPILITSASDEVRSTTRCHICGRTPTDGEKLAPCRTCSELTCRDCFDRIAHVCSKCAASGKSIEHANEGVEPERDEGLVFDSDLSGDSSGEKSGSGRTRLVIGLVLFIVALAVVFYFMDPMGLFKEADVPSPIAEVPVADTTETPVADTLENAGTDTLAMNPDTTESIEPEIIEGDFLALGSLVLSEEYASIEDPPPVSFRMTVPSTVDARILTEQSDVIAGQLAVIAAWIPVELDDAVLLQYHDSTEVLVIVLNHPEETETRLELLRRVSDWLTPSRIDQLVLLYRENRYQNTVIMSLVSANFPLVQGILSPVQFQNYLSFRDDCWESISGPVTQWLTEPR